MKTESPGASTSFTFTTQDIAHYIQKPVVTLKPHLITLGQPQLNEVEKLMAILKTFKSREKPVREQILVNYQDHWLGLDIECKESGAPLSIVLLDAANAINNIAGVTYLLEQMCESEELKIKFDLLHIASLAPIQKNSRDCSIFSWEHLCFAAQKENLHEDLCALKNTEDNLHHSTFAINYATDFFAKKGLNLHAIGRVVSVLNKISWIDYSRLDANPNQWRDFFINTQSCLVERAALDTRINGWIIEQYTPDNRWAQHNIRINYCGHRIKASLEGKEPLSENEFIINMICKSHKQPRENIGQVLRNAVAKGLISQVSKLLELCDVDVNQVPPSGIMALDRAYAIENETTRNIISQLLVSKGAVRGVSGGLHTNHSTSNDGAVMETTSHRL